MQCRGAVGLSCIDIGILFQKRTHALPISPLNRLYQLKVAAGCGQTGEREKQEGDHPPAIGTFDFVTHLPLTFY